MQLPYQYWDTFAIPTPSPKHETLAKELVADAEFRSLLLGTWLGTTDGELISEAVGMVIPPWSKPQYDFVVGGLRLAAQMQQQEGQQKAGQIALGFVGVGPIALRVAAAGREAA